jgi:hypothetical protein
MGAIVPMRVPAGRFSVVPYLDPLWVVRSLDALLRRCQRIEEFTDDAQCVYRVSQTRAKCARTLSDGVSIAAGQPILQIHFWHEHLPAIPRDGPSAAWANVFKGSLRHSYELVADELEANPRWASIGAVQAEPTFAYRSDGARPLTRISELLGFDVVHVDGGKGISARIHGFFDSVLVWGLVWAFNPSGLKSHGLWHGRVQIWMSRQKFIGRYGGRGMNSQIAIPARSGRSALAP